MRIENSVGTATEIRTTLRFPQVDAAKIMFYPRIFELLFRYFPDIPLAKPPFAFSLELPKPSLLGDELQIVFDRNDTSSNWSFSGRVKGVDHFMVRSLDMPDADLSPDSHRSETASFKTDEEQVGGWMSGSDGLMQLSRYFEQVCVAVEEWFEYTLDIPFYQNLSSNGFEIPTVLFRTRCRELPRVGDSVSMWLRAQHLGNSAMNFKSWLVRDDECLVESEQVVVFVRVQESGFKPFSIPADIRRAFTANLET